MLSESRPDSLVARFRNGDPAAFDRIVTEHRETVYRIARRLLGNHEDADEVAQVVFVRAWQARARFRGDSSIRTWLVRIALNAANSMRSGQPALTGIDDWKETADPAEGSQRAIEREELQRSVRRAVEKLSPRQREVVVLKVFSEMTHREVAAALELSEGAVKAHLHQAVSNLRRLMLGEMQRKEIV